jgi:hypothetical protein
VITNHRQKNFLWWQNTKPSSPEWFLKPYSCITFSSPDRPNLKMSLSSNFNETFKRAVTPGSDRLLTGVALVAAARNGRGMVVLAIFVFHVLKRSNDQKQTLSEHGICNNCRELHANRNLLSELMGLRVQYSAQRLRAVFHCNITNTTMQMESQTLQTSTQHMAPCSLIRHQVR